MKTFPTRCRLRIVEKVDELRNLRGLVLVFLLLISSTSEGHSIGVTQHEDHLNNGLLNSKTSNNQRNIDQNLRGGGLWKGTSGIKSLQAQEVVDTQQHELRQLKLHKSHSTTIAKNEENAEEQTSEQTSEQTPEQTSELSPSSEETEEETQDYEEEAEVEDGEGMVIEETENEVESLMSQEDEFEEEEIHEESESEDELEEAIEEFIEEVEPSEESHEEFESSQFSVESSTNENLVSEHDAITESEPISLEDIPLLESLSESSLENLEEELEEDLLLEEQPQIKKKEQHIDEESEKSEAEIEEAENASDTEETEGEQADVEETVDHEEDENEEEKEADDDIEPADDDFEAKLDDELPQDDDFEATDDDFEPADDDTELEETFENVESEENKDDDKIGTNDVTAEIEKELVHEEKVARGLGGAGIFLAIAAMIFTAHQMSENPDGIYASVCRLAITISGCAMKIIFMPCRKLLGTGNPHYGHMPVSTIDYSYREPYRGNGAGNSGFELS